MINLNEDQKKVKYVCEGTCGGEVTEEEYNAGKQTCQALDCPHFQQPFKRVEEPQTEPEVL